MKVLFHNSFHKSYNKRVKNNAKLAAKAQERTRLFEINPQDPILNDHPLKGQK